MRKLKKALKQVAKNTVKKPTNLEECYEYIDSINVADSERFISNPEDVIINTHHGFGRMLRNELGLWDGSKLSRWFKNQGIKHPDDMSHCIIVSYHRFKNGKDVKFDEQVKKCKEFYESMK